jgi:hypothetical protein
MEFDTLATPAPTDVLPGVGVEMPAGWRLLPPETPKPPPVQTSRRPDIIGLLLLLQVIVFHSALNSYWLNVDRHLIRWDEAHHIQQAEAFHDALFPPEARGVLARLMAAVGIESPYPPLSHFLGAAAIHLFGDTPDGAALSGSFALALLLLGIYTLARQGMAPHNALLTAVVASLTPMIYGYSRMVMPDTLCGALVLWALFALLKSDFFRKTGWTLLFSLLCGLALLTKQTALIYLALPMALAWSAGMIKALVPEKAEGDATARRPWPKLLFNLGLCAIVVTAVCSWWYFSHLEYLYTWWSTHRGHDISLFQPGIASRLAGALPKVTETPEARIAFDPAISGFFADTAPLSAASPDTRLLAPCRYFWKRYLIYLVNEVTFLPLALVALAGMPALLLKRNRTTLALLLLAWPLGAYLLLTGLFSLHSPRFLYGMAAAPAFLATFALDAVPFVRLRRLLWGIVLLLLTLQFLNLSLIPFGPAKRLELPVFAQEPEVKQRGNSGITFFKDIIRTGHYILQAPSGGKQVPELLLESMAAHESAHQEAPPAEGAAGTVAWYQEVSPVPSPLGLDFYTRRMEAGLKKDGLRRFAPVKAQSQTAEGTLPELAETVYVVLYQPLEGDYIAALEENMAFFLKQGFQNISALTIEEDNPAGPGYAHVLARKGLPDLEKTSNLFEVYNVLALDGKNYLLSDEERAALEKRYTRALERYTGNRQPMNDNTSLLELHVGKASDNWYLLRLIIHCKKAYTEGNPLRIWMRAKVHEADRDKLFEPQKGLPDLVWDVDPEPPASRWKSNEALVFTRPVMARPLRYQVELGLYNPEIEEKPTSLIRTEWVDFRSIE